MEKISGKNVWRIFTLVWAAVIFVTMVMPAVPGPEVPYLAEVGHFVEFFVLGLLLVKSFDRASLLSAGLFYGVFVETLQVNVPGRTFSFVDMIINVVGLAVGFFLFKTVMKRPRGLNP